MDFVILWFVMTLTASGGEPVGYIPPQDVHKIDMRCGLPGRSDGLQVNSLINPSLARWPDPGIPEHHCEVSIVERVQALLPGEYHSCTTEVGLALPFGSPELSYIGIDPHCTDTWRRTDSNLPSTPFRPGPLRVSPQP